MQLLKALIVQTIQMIYRLLRQLISGTQKPDISSCTAYILGICVIIFSIISFFFYPEAGAQTFTSSGTWTVPAGTTSAIMEAWGAGGAGAGATTTGTGGGGGSGGCYAKATISVTVGQAYTVTVGGVTAGGTGAGAIGANSKVANPSSVTVVQAEGGRGGTTTGTTPGVVCTSSVGSVLHNGGNGAAGSTSSATAGAGGGGAGSTADGGSASGTTPGTGSSVNGGNGGSTGSNSTGGTGSNYGGGGGGATKTGGGNKSGGAGAQGLVIITPVSNSSPTAPTLSLPSSGATGVSTAPQFQLSSTDTDSDYIEYRIYLYQSDCTTAISGSPFMETSSQTGWSGQNANSNTAYTSGSTATYTYQGTLSLNTTYCWKADAIDPAGSNTYSGVSSTQLFTTSASSSVTIRQEINIIDKQQAVSTTSGGIIQLDTTKYSGTVSYYFEVVTGTASASTDTVSLTRNGTSINDATITLAGTAANVRVRSSAFTPPAGQTEYVVTSGAAHAINAARIIIMQTSSSITSTESQFEIGNEATGRSNASEQPFLNQEIWHYTAANWTGSPTFYVEVTKNQAQSSNTTTFTLQQDDGTFNNWVDLTTVVNADSTQPATRFRVSFTPTDGRNYRMASIESANSGGKTYGYFNAKIIVDQTSPTVLEAQYLINNTPSSTGIVGYPTLWNSSDWSGNSTTFKYAIDSQAAQVSNGNLVDIDNGNSTIANSAASGANQSYSPSFTMPTSGHQVDANITLSGSYASRIIVTVTLGNFGSASGPTTDQVMRGGTYFSNGSKQPIYWAQ